MNNIEKGKLGEEIASRYIQSKGGIIIEQNYRTKIGEIDLIAKINGELVFVEVKSRSSINYGYPSEAVNYKKQRKITNVAKYYILDTFKHPFQFIQKFIYTWYINIGKYISDLFFY